jgi:arsenate reductase
MAEAWLHALGGERYETASAGTEATRVHPLAVRAMGEVGVDLGGHTSKRLERFLGERWDWVITVCDAANEACPVFPGAAQRLHWSFDDPSSTTGSDEARLAIFRRVRDEIRTKLTAWLTDRRPADAITMRKP